MPRHSTFPLNRHNASGRWCKSLTLNSKRRFYYFYRLDDDPSGTKSLKWWNHDKEYLMAGMEPPEFNPDRPSHSFTTVKDACNYWIGIKKTARDAGELAESSYREYHASCQILMEILGAGTAAEACGPAEFQAVRDSLAKRYGLNGQAKRIGHVRSIFETAADDQVITKRANFGRSFKRPAARAMRKLRAAKGNQSFQPAEIQAILSHAGVNMRAMILLGLQAGLGNEDCASLPRDAIRDGWVDWARGKTGVQRRFKLWDETRMAINEAIEHADGKGEACLCFIGARGKPYVTERKNGYRVHGEFVRARDAAKVNPDRTFYDLRRTFETVGGETADQVAVSAIMGHIPPESDMAARYRQGVSDERLEAVTTHVRKWLGEIPKGGAK